MNDICPVCEKPLTSDGDQVNVVRGTVLHLASCMNPLCDMYRGTFTIHERQMTLCELRKYAETRQRMGIS